MSYLGLIVDLSIQEQKHLSLSEADFSRLAAIVKVLKNTSFYHTSKLADADMVLLLKILKSWPSQMMFPGAFLL
jgi:phospholipase A-2-activating protein